MASPSYCAKILMFPCAATVIDLSTLMFHMRLSPFDLQGPMDSPMWPFAVNFGTNSRTWPPPQMFRGFVLAILTKFSNIMNFPVVVLALLDYCDLTDMVFTGPKFTWHRLAVHPFTQRARLERSLCNLSFHHLFSDYRITNTPTFTSDHTYIFVQLSFNKFQCLHPPKSKPRRFESYWIKSADCERIISENWSATVGDISVKMENCLLGLINWNKFTFGDLTEKINRIKKDIARLEGGLITPDIKQQLTTLHARLDMLLEFNDLKWKQRAKQYWYKNGDRNTSFFHAHASQRQSTNHIASLKDPLGHVVPDPVAIEQLIVNYFDDIFTSSSPSMHHIRQALDRVPTKLSKDMIDRLSNPFSATEVVKAIKNMHPYKSLGPDSMSPIFFKKFWSIIGDDISKSVLHFLNTKEMPRGLYFTHIVLISKVKNSDYVSQFRPISICNVIYRIASKVITNRVRPLLVHIISETQSSFIPGRQITDNILVAYEIHHSMKARTKGKRGLMSTKLDMSKAFDRVEWSFVFGVLKSLGFPDNFIDLIHVCITSSSFSFLLNGSQFGAVTPHRGIRLGDPLSPYIFIICAEVFSIILQDLQAAGKIHGIQVPKNAPCVSHLFFADDTLLFGNATVEEAKFIRFAISLFRKASGQQVNFEKSGIVFSPHIDASIARSISQLLGIPIMSSHGKYLGLPSVIGKNKKEIFTSIQDRVWKRIQGWKEKTLSQAGRDILIKSVV
ncbi:hypothetical protein DH2020_004094 [Rehmannia glutinosa]|uniref:Reverse transcriptase domain-containing protein n=1 Tax=Rehmannia glutinosa TaxID=99300 RepID=A0ABR0XNG7_REHGL